MDTNYLQYLESKEWQQLRAKILRRDKVCVVCGTRMELDVHHLTYVRFRHEHHGDLVAICRRHHDKVHYNFLGLKISWNEDRMLVRLTRAIRKGKQRLAPQQIVFRFIIDNHK